MPKRIHRWRVQSDDRGHFDEIAVSLGPLAPLKQDPYGADGLLLHAEMTDDDSCFVDVAGFCLWAHRGRDGVVRITMVEDRRSARQKMGAADIGGAQ